MQDKHEAGRSGGETNKKNTDGDTNSVFQTINAGFEARTPLRQTSFDEIGISSIGSNDSFISLRGAVEAMSYRL